MRKAIRLCRICVLVMLVLAAFVACETTSTYQKSYKTLSVTKETALFLAKTAKDLYAGGVISEAKLAQIHELYNHVRSAQIMLVDAQTEALDSTDKAKEEQVTALSVVYLKTMTDFVNLAIEIGLIRNGDPRISEGG